MIGSGADEGDAFESQQLAVFRIAEDQEPSFVLRLGEFRGHGLMERDDNICLVFVVTNVST